LKGVVFDDDLDDDNDDNSNNDNDDHFGMEYNATVYDGRENSVAAVHQARLSTSPSNANVTANIAPDPSTLCWSELIAAAKEALRVQRLLDRELAVLQETILSIQNQSQINNIKKGAL
jgi:hypothetical protein